MRNDKNKKLRTVILSIFVVVLAIAAAVVSISKKNNPAPPAQIITETESGTATEYLTETEIESIIESDEEDNETTAETISEITETETEKKEKETGAQKKASASAASVRNNNPDREVGIRIIGNGDEEDEKYSCGIPGHKCETAEMHNYILRLENIGCEYCHSHSCPSFYAVDQHGVFGPDPEKCPEYSIYKDPTYYCQDCKKKVGDGKNNTCVKYINACYCYECGKYVESLTCHTCD